VFEVNEISIWYWIVGFILVYPLSILTAYIYYLLMKYKGYNRDEHRIIKKGARHEA